MGSLRAVFVELWHCRLLFIKPRTPYVFPALATAPGDEADLLACVFPRLTELHAFVSSSDWFVALFASAVIGKSNNFGLGFTTLN